MRMFVISILKLWYDNWSGIGNDVTKTLLWPNLVGVLIITDGAVVPCNRVNAVPAQLTSRHHGTVYGTERWKYTSLT